MLRRLLVLLSLVLANVPCVMAQSASPNVERGVSPGKSYAVGDLDTINLFNGNLNVGVPLGQAYRVGGNLGYRFSLHFGGNSWEYSQRQYSYFNGSQVVDGTYDWAYPSRMANAGFGWLFSLGAMTNTLNSSGGWSYISPDGGMHDFYYKLHGKDSNEGSGAYTRDGTYLRLTTGSDLKLEFPNGEIHHFRLSDGKLMEMDDQYGNWVRIAYNDPNVPAGAYGSATTWHITDSAGRHHYVYFRSTAAYTELDMTPSGQSVSHESVAEVRLAAVNGTYAKYIFQYEGSASSTWSTVSRPCGSNPDPSRGPSTIVTLLTGITTTVTDQAAVTTDTINYAFDYDRGYDPPASPPSVCSAYWGPGDAPGSMHHAPGSLTALTLPTGGRITWNYQPYHFPDSSADIYGLTHAPGVFQRQVFAAGGSSISLTQYETAQSTATVPSREKTTKVTVLSSDNTVDTSSTYYFSTCISLPLKGAHAPQCTAGSAEYGLQLTRLTNDGSSPPRYLSKSTTLSDGTMRKTYVRYEGDELLDGTTASSSDIDKNRRIVSESTLYENGTAASVTYSSFDGLGHYRRTTTDGSFGHSDTRVLFSNFNSSTGDYQLTSDGTAVVSTYHMISAATPWILGMSSFQTAADSATGPASMTQTCFDSTGFMTRRRSLGTQVANQGTPTLLNTDLMQVLSRDTNGNLIRQQFLGGDADHFDSGDQVIAPTPSDTCNGSFTGEAYRIDYSYATPASGVLTSAQYVDASGNAIGPKTVDLDADLNTGLPSKTREGGSSGYPGLETNYEYDSLGRLLYVKPKNPTGVSIARDGWTKYTYASNPPRLDVYQQSADGVSNLTHSWTEFDVLGRSRFEGRELVGGVQTKRETRYTGAGWRSQVSELEPTPTHFTTFTYDMFGRLLTASAPDASQSAITYNGISSTQKTVKSIQTGTLTVPTTSDSTITESYDRQGRLWNIQEPSGVVTQYSYDIGGRLASVCMNVTGSSCGQTRAFTYDQRGLLTSEQHPEKGASGNGITTYEYDARGHVKRRLDGAASGLFDIIYSYDRAERLTDVKNKGASSSSTRILKHFDYATDNQSTDYRNGKRWKATRFNWITTSPFHYNIQVVETYTFGGREGRASARNTDEFECDTNVSACTSLPSGTPLRTFAQSFTYDDLGELTGQTYPSCLTNPCAAAGLTPPSVTNSFSSGLLTGVTFPAPGGTSSGNGITYSNNGTVSQVSHSNGVTDTQYVDPFGMTRPSRLTATGALDSSTCTPVSIATNPVSTTYSSGQGVVLTAVFTGDSDQTAHPTQVHWYLGNTGDTGAEQTSGLSTTTTGGTTTTTLTVSPSSNRSYWVQGGNGCGANANSATAILTLCAPPTIDSTSPDVTITRGQTAHISVTVSTPGVTYQWYQGYAGAEGAPQQGQTSSSLDITPGANPSADPVTLMYWVKVTSPCSSTASTNSVRIVIIALAPPSVPANFSAHFDGSGVQLSWNPSNSGAGISHYEIRRFDGTIYNTFLPNIAGSYTAASDTIAAGAAASYMIRAVDNNGIASPYSLPDLATSILFTDDPLQQNVSLIKGIHIGELRQAIDAVRVRVNLARQWASYAAATGVILPGNIQEMRDVLAEARIRLGLPTIFYTDAILTSGQSLIRSQDIQELRDGVK